MTRSGLSVAAAALICGALPGQAARAEEPPRMPYAFETYCHMCHKAGVQIGPMQIFDMKTKTGNPLHEQYIRNNVRFGLRAMPAFRVSEIGPRELDEIVSYMKAVAAYRRAHPEYQPAPAAPAQEGGAKR
jgi:mono/diheme cytochrome c family protein